MRSFSDVLDDQIYLYDHDPENYLADYIECVLFTLRTWVKLHTDAEQWARNQLMDDDLLYTFKHVPIMENYYYRFDWREETYRPMAERWIREGYLVRCSVCSTFLDRYEDCDCEAETNELEEGDLDDLIWWLKDIQAEVEESDLWESLVTAGFSAYYDAVYPVFAGVLEDIQDSIKDIEEALRGGDPGEILAAVMAGTQVYHVSGNVMADYGSYANLEYCFVDRVRNEGLEAVFGEEAIHEYCLRFSL